MKKTGMNIISEHKIGIMEKFPLHIHNSYEIFLSMSSKCEFFVGEDIYDVNRYDVFLFNAGDIHRINPIEDADKIERYVVMFPPSFFGSGFSSVKKFRRLFEGENGKRKVKLSLSKGDAEKLIELINKMIESENDKKIRI